MKTADRLSELEKLFLALADRTRLRLLQLMRDGEVCVQYLTDALGVSQPKISRHLAYLRNAGLVEARRDGKWIYYRPAALNEPAARLLGATLECLAEPADPPFDGQKPAAVSGGPEMIESTRTMQTFEKAQAASERKTELEIFLL